MAFNVFNKFESNTRLIGCKISNELKPDDSFALFKTHSLQQIDSLSRTVSKPMR